MEPTTQTSGYWQPEDPPPPTAGWWQASNGQWYPPVQPYPTGPPASPGGSYQWPAPGSGSPVGPPSMPPQWGVPLWQAPTKTGNGFSITGIVLGSVAILFVPPLFGILGLIFGGVGLSRKERLAPVAMIVASIGLVVGIILGVVVAGALHHGG